MQDSEIVSLRQAAWRRLTGTPSIAAKVRFVCRISFSDDRGCWLWTGNRDKDGYGKFGLGGLRAHRLAFAWTHEDFAPDAVLDHLCGQKGCVNPDHLEVVSWFENSHREIARRRFCANGHEFTPENTQWSGRGYRRRRCRACRIAVKRERLARLALGRSHA